MYMYICICTYIDSKESSWSNDGDGNTVWLRLYSRAWDYRARRGRGGLLKYWSLGIAMHTSRKSGSDFSGQKQVEGQTSSRVTGIIIYFYVSPWIIGLGSFFYLYFVMNVIYIYIICSGTYDQEMYGKKDSFLIENLLRYVSFFFFSSESSRRFYAWYEMHNFRIRREKIDSLSLCLFRDRER